MRPPASLPLPRAADELGVHYMTAYRYVRTGVLPATRVGGQWRVDPADLAAVRNRDRPRRRPGSAGWGDRLVRRQGRLERRMVAGDEVGAWAVVDDALASGASPTDVLLVLLAGALRSVGDRWQAGTLSVGEEHRATAVAQRLVGRLGPLGARRGRRRGTVLIGTPPDERHQLPVAIAGDLLRAAAYEVIDLGADVPVETFADAAVGEPGLTAVALGVTGNGHDAAVRAVVRDLTRAVPSLPVLVGGRAVPDATRAAELGARWSGTDGAALVRAVDVVAAELRAR